MIKTFSVSGGTFAKFGGVSVQPVEPITPTSSAASAVTPTIETIKPSDLIVPIASAISGPSSEPKKSLNVAKVVKGLSTDPDFKVASVVGDGFGTVIPSFKIDVRATIPTSSDDMTISTRKFEPYESLTGISHERPEIVFLTNFQPLYDNAKNDSSSATTDGIDGSRKYMKYMVDGGAFFDAQMHIRNLRQVNVRHLLSRLKENYPTIASEFDSRSQTFSYIANDLSSTASYVWTLTNILDRMKDQLDLRNDSYKADTQSVLRKQVDSFSLARSKGLLEHLNSAGNTTLPDSFDSVDVLSYYGYVPSNVKSSFSSTKIWLQIAYEMKDALRSHSASMLGIDTPMQRQDTNPASITKALNIKKFSYGDSIPNIPKLSDLVKTKVAGMSKTLSSITTAYNVMYENVVFKNDEMKIAALCNAITKEFRYSRGLGSADVQKTLRDSYGYTTNVAGGNMKFIDAVVGQFGNNISDIPALSLNNSVTLTDIAQKRVSDQVAVLTFESKYVDGDTGTLTPGSTYYVDSIWSGSSAYDTTKLKELSSWVKRAHTSLSSITNGMNFFASEYVDQTDPGSSGWDLSMTNPRALFKKVLELFVTNQVVPLPDMRDDSLAAVFSAASTNVRLRSALFMHVMMSLSRSYTMDVHYLDSDASDDNTPSTDYLVDQIMTILNAAPSTVTSVKTLTTTKYLEGTSTSKKTLDTTQITASALKEAIRGGFSRCYIFIMNVMRRVLSSFRFNDIAMVNGVTMHGGYIDTMIMMSLFDVVLTVLRLFGGQMISGEQNDKGILTYTITHGVEKHVESMNDIVQRLETELALTQQSLIFFLNALDKVNSATTNVINYLESDSTVKELTKISSVLNDQVMLKLLMNKQQAMLFSATIADVIGRLSSNGSSLPSDDVDADADIQIPELKCLDDSAVDTRLRDAVLNFFSRPEFASSKSFNKRIMTVGIPLGFTSKLKQKINIKNVKKNSFNEKESDVVNVVVYKIDAKNPDVVFRPIKFPFELSRFPVKDSSTFKTTRGSSDTVSSVPTRNMDEPITSGRSIQFWPGSGSDVSAMSTKEYDFLDVKTKTAIHRNHVTSHMLEVYLRVLLGVSTSDYDFDLVTTTSTVEPNFVKLLVDHSIDWLVNAKVENAAPTSTATRSGGTFFSSTAPTSISLASSMLRASAPMGGMSTKASTGVDGAPLDASPRVLAPRIVPSLNVDANLSRLTTNDVSTAMHILSTISDFSCIRTTLSDVASTTKKLLQPRQFDRVFNVIVDPDDFEVDVEMMLRSEQGSTILKSLIQRREIVEKERPTSLGPGSSDAASTQTYVCREKNKDEGDISFEKYIVTIETLDEAEVF